VNTILLSACSRAVTVPQVDERAIDAAPGRRGAEKFLRSGARALSASARRGSKASISTVAAGLLLTTPAHADNGDTLAAFRPLTGAWQCRGQFTRTDAPIAARLTVTADAATQSLMLRHDDIPPNTYHAVELWGIGGKSGPRAAIADAYGGVRWFVATGWTGPVLDWDRVESGETKERFRYTLLGGGRFTIEWFAQNANGQLVSGDRVTCAHA
jgi:hypothetical protein